MPDFEEEEEEEYASPLKKAHSSDSPE